MKRLDGLALTGAVEKKSEAHGGGTPNVPRPLQGGIIASFPDHLGKVRSSLAR